MNMTSRPTLKDIPRQRWLRIIPPILIACIISYMDRVNIAFAMPGGMDEELGISATMAGLAGGIFFIGYLFLQVPGGKIAVHGSGKKFIGWSLVAWAVISVLTGLITNQYQLLVLRFLLGVAEGGMLPVVLTMISNWFPDAERGRANAIVIMFVPIAGIITARSRAGLSPFSTGAGCSSLKVCFPSLYWCCGPIPFTTVHRRRAGSLRPRKITWSKRWPPSKKPLPERKSKMPLWARCFPIKPCGSSSR
jgi:MFS family permease